MIKNDINKTDKKLLRKSCLRTLSLSGSFTFEKMQGLGFLCSMLPFIDHYNKDKQSRVKAYKRQWTTFNTTPTVGTYISGIIASMEKQAAQEKEYDTSKIEATKSSLMAPVASIGDFLCWGTLRVVSLSVGLSLALQGSLWGIILHLLIFNLPTSFARYYGSIIGFSKGTSFMTDLAQNGSMNFVNKAASILALTMTGALAFIIIKPNINLDWFKSILPTAAANPILSTLVVITPLALVFGCFGLIKKGVKGFYITIIILALSLLGAYFKIF